MAKKKCDKCDRPATTHSVEIIKGQKIEKHLCDLHAAEEGLADKVPHQPINELLTNLVKAHSGETIGPVKTGTGSESAAKKAKADPACEHCGTTFAMFREKSLLGCSACYQLFESQMSPLLERAHEGATHHVGKAPRRAGAGEQRQHQLTHLRKRLGEAVTVEDYELAARLRDEIERVETH